MNTETLSTSDNSTHDVNRSCSIGDYTDVQKAAYKKFQIYWLYDHGFGMKDIFQAMEDACNAISCAGEDIYSGSLWEAFEEIGLGGGSLYPCFDEFLAAEYKDAGLMHRLLTEEEFDIYAKERSFSAAKFRIKAEAICVETPHGVIRAARKTDSDYPGIELDFISEKSEIKDYGPGAMMEYHPHYHGFNHENEYSQEKVVMWIYSREQFQDDPCTVFEME